MYDTITLKTIKRQTFMMLLKQKFVHWSWAEEYGLYLIKRHLTFNQGAIQVTWIFHHNRFHFYSHFLEQMYIINLMQCKFLHLIDRNIVIHGLRQNYLLNKIKLGYHSTRKNLCYTFGFWRALSTFIPHHLPKFGFSW